MYGATIIVNDHPEFEWNVNGVKKLLKKIDETDDFARKEDSGRPKSVCTEANIELVRKLFLARKISQELILHQQKLHVNLILIVDQCPV